METRFDPYRRNYASLSVKDLLDARDAYHVHLCHFANVFSTAVGLFRLRRKDPDSKRYVSPGTLRARRGAPPPRTLENSVVRPWSWPCLLVFVREWLTPEQLHRAGEQRVPPFLYLRDGRVIPTCVVLAAAVDTPRAAVGPLLYTSHVIGGGYRLITQVQGAVHSGTVGCLVTDGERYFALTSEHVTGDPGRIVSAEIAGRMHRVGVSATNSLRKLPFEKAFPGLPGSETESNLDVGLVDLDDIAQWTAQVFGLGRLGAMIDFDTMAATLNWIGARVVAHGGASGRMEGEIKALFYRYRTLAGTEYVSDFLIGGRDERPLVTGPGDSGAVWCIDPDMLQDTQDRDDAKSPAGVPDPVFRPVAVQWGGQKLAAGSGAKVTQFALASSLAIACRELDVDPVTDLRAELPQYWGAIGHYKIAAIAADHVGTKLSAFLTANIDRLTYPAATLATGSVAHDASAFVPLADVPDIVWKTNMNRGGKAARPQENWCHYADMDLAGADGRTLDEICGSAPTRLRLDDWIAFYRSAPPPAAAKSKTVNMGALPFRVWQVFEAMRQARIGGRKAEFLCSSGILAHYIGDACQPLHGSVHADGLDGAQTGVHGAYEEKMIDVFAADLGPAIDALDFDALGDPLPAPKSGHEAAVQCVELMRRSRTRLTPEQLCTLYDDLGGGTSKAVIAALWAELHEATVACIADGARTLAALWDAAYGAASGAHFSGAVSRTTLKRLYERKTFLPSLHIANVKAADYPVPS